MLIRLLTHPRLLRIPAASTTTRFFSMSSQTLSEAIAQQDTQEVPAVNNTNTTTATVSPSKQDPAGDSKETTVHVGSKRHKESKHNHYGGQQLNKKKKYKIDPTENEESLKNAEYFFENGLRKVRPYFYRYQTYAKGRWLGRELIEVMNTEFRDRDTKYYEKAIKDGLITINGNTVTGSYIMRNSDVLEHSIHRHEPPVADSAVKVVLDQDGVLVVDKPSSIPVHPSGRYRHNTILHILMKEQGYKFLYPANRLDRLTSGLMLIAKSVEKARDIETMMRQCEIHKQYICKVRGEFPSGVTECHESIKVACFKLTLSVVHPEGKQCSTIFERLQYDKETNTSIVLAKPITGRTHQIRVHLQFLGHPIANDPLYHNTSIWGPTNGQGGVSAEMEKAVVAKFNERVDQEDEFDLALAEDSVGLVEVENSQAGFCAICRQPNKPDPAPEKRGMYLHAWKYRTKDWSYETTLPAWASGAAKDAAAATLSTLSVESAPIEAE
ncbi:hypothetical protein DFQ27_003574 [Actinomortierella ambigua]|uniref:Pseudouridine synthase n=1 Tax=Actinomortierella ambigua TaxID=1343610 RepID=A0A9P6Q658_9FUNG|nr:hypothetical protein DFQ27_003574 [Actinomortierella ambigua]